MFSNGIYVQTTTGTTTLISAEARDHRERMLAEARDARLARRARKSGATRNGRSSGLNRLRAILHRTTAGAPAVR